jgi:ubiquinone/menaquinone biosynthesis C-methylase UbiE
MIFLDESFDLILAMFVLHEMPAPIRSLVINEAKRVMRKTGRFLIIDYHSGPIRFPKGWFYRIVSIFFEVLAGREHFKNYRDFMANRGMPPLIVENDMLIDKQRIISGGTAGIYLLHKG